mmetsp:Transcript_16514/g.24368  ORF Transcript_16514/g.24368 Transcript_16514/m.24368 type:complete len:244 (+) Transcript_16514:2883-3614(+)
MKSQKEEEGPRPATPTLSQYNAYHSMVCSPSTAVQCSDSFNGSVIFIPAGTTVTSSTPDYCKLLNAITYYGLVLISLTGLSTLLGLTEFVEYKEISVSEQSVVMVVSDSTKQNDKTNEELMQQPLSPHLRPKNCEQTTSNDNNIAVSMDALRYIADKHSSSSDLSDLRIVRKFEYNFRLLGLNVIMCHLKSKNNKNDEEEVELLHLVEVYQFRNPLVRSIVEKILLFMLHIISPKDGKKKKKE